MLNFTRLAVIFASVAILAPSFASAETNTGGDLQTHLEMDNAVNLAIGDDVHAAQSIATIHDGTDIGGDATINVKMDNAVNLAIGRKAYACQSLASVGVKRDCTN